MEQIKNYIKNNGLASKKSNESKILTRYYMYAYLKSKKDMSYAAIGRMFGGKSHSSVMSGVRKHNELLTGANRVFYMSTVAATAMKFPLDGMGKIELATTNSNEKRVKVTGNDLKRLSMIKKSLGGNATYEDAVSYLIKSCIIIA